MTQQLPVLVSGGGIGGLAAALALVRQGFEVTVFEQAPEIGEIGAGIQHVRGKGMPQHARRDPLRETARVAACLITTWKVASET